MVSITTTFTTDTFFFIGIIWLVFSDTSCEIHAAGIKIIICTLIDKIYELSKNKPPDDKKQHK